MLLINNKEIHNKANLSIVITRKLIKISMLIKLIFKEEKLIKELDFQKLRDFKNKAIK